jgi:class 3 adenylate cyclase/tetratricopeptide (TPR) repeat protein
MSASPCAACGFANPAGALYCGNCGSALGRPCPSCGTVVSRELTFCTSCGAALAEEERVRGAEERKVVSVVFVDLVGFTSRAEKLDPEDVGGLQTPYYARVRKEIQSYGGTVEKFIGDAVVAVFGAPVAHEDDPARAVLAALAVHDAIADMNADDPTLELHIRLAVTTGEALVRLDARPERGEGIAAGDVVNTASRLQSAAPVDGILVDGATRRASEHLVEYRGAGAVLAKGKSEPVSAWEAVARIARLGVDIAFRGGASLVGRDVELGTLRDALTRAERARATQLVTLVGVPGIGKSRLVWELYEALQTDPNVLVMWRQGRSLPYGEGVAFWALGELTKAHAGVLESDDALAAEAKLRAAVDTVIPDEEQARWVEGHLRPLAGLAGSAAPGSASRDEAFAAWRRFFEAIAEQNPLVLVFEDLHWADDDLLDFVDYLADSTSEVPAILVCTARPELLDRRPGWGGGKRNATTISLAPLTDAETNALLSSLLANGALGEEGRRELVTRAGGNPLYAEEYVRMLAQAEEELPLPESVQGIIAARLDTLPPDEKGLVHGAAIVGKVFWPAAIASVLGLDRAEVEHTLHTLERKEFVRRERRSSIAGDTAYVFRHSLVRDVAYSQIPRARRADLHRLAASWIEALASDRPEDLADMVAYHYLSALDLNRKAGREDADLVARTRAALVEAGDRSFALNAFPAAARFYGEVLALSPESDPGRPRVLLDYGRALFHAEGGGMEALREAADELLDAGEVELAATALVAIADIYFFVEGQGLEASRNLDMAVELLAERPPSREKAITLANRARFFMIGERAAEAIEVGREADAMAEDLGLADLQANVLNTIGVARVQSGDIGGFEDMEKSIAIAPPHSYERMRALNNLAATLAQVGDLKRADDLWAQSLEAAQRYGHAVALKWIESQGLDQLYWNGEWDELMERTNEYLAQDEPGSASVQELDAHIFRARVRLARDDTQGALEESAAAVELARTEGDPQIVFPALATHARVLLESGREPEAAALADELLDSWSKNPASTAGPWMSELAPVLAALGRESDILAAHERASLRTRWLEAAVKLAAGNAVGAAEDYAEIGAEADAAITRVRAAEQLVSAGRREEAEAQLELALEFLRTAGAERYVREAETMLPVA